MRRTRVQVVARRLALGLGLMVAAISGVQAAEFETGSVDLKKRTIDSSNGNAAWKNVNFDASFAAAPVIVAGPITENNDEYSLSVRVRDVTTGGFEIALTSPCDSADADPNAAGNPCPPSSSGNSPPWETETVRWLAVPAGEWTFPDGTKIEAGREDVSAVRSGVAGGDDDAGAEISINADFATRPVVLHTVNTTDNTTDSEAWITSSVFGPANNVSTPPDANGFTLALEGAEVTASHAAETVGWVAIEPGSGTNNGNRYHAGVSDDLDTPRHDNGCDSQGSFTGFTAPPDVIAGHNTMDGTNGAWLRYCGNGITTGGIEVHVDEDQVGDGERGGLDEATSWFAFEADGKGLLLAPVTIDPFFARETFEPYTAGASIDGSNDGAFWADPWSGEGGAIESVVDVSSDPLSVTTDGDTIAGGERALRFDGNDDEAATRQLARTIDEPVVYASMLVRFEGQQDGNDFLGLWFEESGFGDAPNFGIKMNEGGSGSRDFFARSRQNAAYDTDLVDGRTYLLVARIRKTNAGSYDRASLWVDPVELGNPAPPTPDAESSVADSGLASFDTIGFRGVNLDSNDQVFVDELRVGTSWSEVTAPNVLPIQRGRVTIDTEGGDGFRTIGLSGFDHAPVVLATASTDRTDDPAAARVNNVSAAGFDLAPVEPPSDDGPHPPLELDYVALGEIASGEQKLYLIDIAEFAELRRHETTTVQGKNAGSTGWDSLSLLGRFAAPPAVLGAVQSMRNDNGNPPQDASVPWLETSVANVTNADYDLALERAETSAGSVSNPETVGLAIFPDGARGTLDGLDYEALLSSDSIRGFSNGCYATSFSTAFAEPPVVTANRNTRDGLDGGWIRRCDLDTGSVGLTVDEDQDAGNERSHIGEQAAILAVTGVAGSGVDHYAVLDPGTGLTCEALPVMIEARDDTDSAMAPATGTAINVFARAPGTSNPAPDSSWASTGTDQTSHTFDGSSTSVTLELRRTSPGLVNVDVDDGTATESASDDPDIDFVESGFLFYADGSAGAIGNQIAAKPSNTAPGSQTVGLRAVEDPNGSVPGAACEARLTDDQEIEMAFECLDPSSCSAGRNVAIDRAPSAAFGGTDIAANNAGSVSAYSAVTLDFGSNGRAPFALRYPDAGAIRLHVREDLPAQNGDPAITLTGESNAFVVRPFGFRVTASGNPGATGPGGGVLGAAGEDFTVEVTAVGWSSSDDQQDSNGDPNPDGVPDGYGNGDPTDNASLDPPPGGDNVTLPNFGAETDDEEVTLQASLWKPDPGSDPGLAGATTIGEAAFENAGDVGAGAGSATVNHPEVGIIELRANLGDNNYQGGADVRGRSGPVGRFTPADFAVSVRDAGMYATTCNAAFSYIGEAFGYDAPPVLAITARNADGATTVNYRDGFIKLVDNDVDVTPPSSDTSKLGNVSGIADVAVSPSPVPALGVGTMADDGNGDPLRNGVIVYTFDNGDRYSYDKVHNARVDEFTADLRIKVDAVTDGDGVSDALLPSPNPFKPMGVSMRFGRLIIDDAFGPETAPVEQRWRIEAWRGSNWATNGADGCTSLALNSDVELTGDGGTSAGDATVTLNGSGGTGQTDITSGAVAFTGGTTTVVYAAPGAGERGWIDVASTLGSDHHLLIDANADGNNDGPYDTESSARVTFGIFAGEEQHIYLREVFPAP